MQGGSRGGTLYIAFPAENTVYFPNRRGTLNFYDDTTHHEVLNYNSVLNALKENGFKIIFATRNYKPPIGFVLGAITEVFVKDHITPFTWDYWGFESVIWARRD